MDEDLVKRYSALLLNDLMFSAPEMWSVHISKRMKELLNAREET